MWLVGVIIILIIGSQAKRQYLTFYIKQLLHAQQNTLLFCFALNLFFLFHNLDVLQSQGKITLKILRGSAKIYSAENIDNFIQVNSSHALKLGEIIQTKKGSRAQILYPDKTRFKIKPEAKIKILANGLRIKKGKVLFQVVKRGSNFRVETPTMICGVRGTMFDVAVSQRKNMSAVRVYQGAVAVRSTRVKNAPKLLLKKGMALIVGKNVIPRKAIRFNFNASAKEWLGNKWKKAKTKTKAKVKAKKKIDKRKISNTVINRGSRISFGRRFVFRKANVDDPDDFPTLTRRGDNIADGAMSAAFLDKSGRGRRKFGSRGASGYQGSRMKGLGKDLMRQMARRGGAEMRAMKKFAHSRGLKMGGKGPGAAAFIKMAGKKGFAADFKKAGVEGLEVLAAMGDKRPGGKPGFAPGKGPMGPLKAGMSGMRDKFQQGIRKPGQQMGRMQELIQKFGGPGGIPPRLKEQLGMMGPKPPIPPEWKP
ncbi:FecR domain-containing protein [Candidatus Riflebacteria bacterium]